MDGESVSQRRRRENKEAKNSVDVDCTCPEQHLVSHLPDRAEEDTRLTSTSNQRRSDEARAEVACRTKLQTISFDASPSFLGSQPGSPAGSVIAGTPPLILVLPPSARHPNRMQVSAVALPPGRARAHRPDPALLTRWSRTSGRQPVHATTSNSPR